MVVKLKEKGSMMVFVMGMIATLGIASVVVTRQTENAITVKMAYRSKGNRENLESYLKSVVDCAETRKKVTETKPNCSENKGKAGETGKIGLFRSNKSAVIAFNEDSALRFGKYTVTAYCGNLPDRNLYIINALPTRKVMRLNSSTGNAVEDDVNDQMEITGVKLDCRL